VAFELETTRFPDGGGRIVHRLRRPARQRCAYCQMDSTKLCDHVLPGGKTCDKPMCLIHTAAGAQPGTDLCREHRKEPVK